MIVGERLASDQNLLVGDVYDLRTPANSSIALSLPVRIVGIWRPNDPRSDYWFLPSQVFGQMLLVPEESFAAVVDNPSVGLVGAAAWYTAFDGSAVRSNKVASLTEAIDSITGDVQRLLPGSELTKSPTAALARHREQVRVLTINLALFSVPLLGLLGAFTMQVAATLVQQQQQEIAVLRSRGSTSGQIVSLVMAEAALLGGAALLVGLPLGLGIAQLMFWTQSFLQFVPAPGPPIDLLERSWLHGAVVVALMLPATVLPAVGAARRTIISFKQNRARSRGASLLILVLSDIILLLPALYGYQQLSLQGMISVPGASLPADDPFRNPLLLLAPALFVFALTLLAIHMLAPLLALLAWACKKLPGVALLLALRSLSRSTESYRTPVMLIALTLSLAVFTASMARTLDQHSQERARYRAAADVRLSYQNAGSLGSADIANIPGAVSPSGGSIDYLFIPADDYLTIPGVQAVSRAARSQTNIQTDGLPLRGTFLAIDRQNMAAVLTDSWQDDYANGESLGALMNRLADQPDAVLVSASYAAQHGFRVGDRISLELNDRGTAIDVPFGIVGTVDYFPSLYSEEGPYFIGNLDYSADQQGGLYPYEIWLDLAPDASLMPIKEVAQGRGLQILDETPQELLATDTARPERQGLFGLLSVGFLASALVTLLGFLLATLRSFRRRMVELGTLRAIGLSTGQLTALLLCEQALVIGTGALLGSGLGVLASRLFVPFLQVRTGTFPDTPPFRVAIATTQLGQIYIGAGILLVCAIIFTLILLRRMRIFEAVKLGETV